jgi:hypothetical protein
MRYDVAVFGVDVAPRNVDAFGRWFEKTRDYVAAARLGVFG